MEKRIATRTSRTAEMNCFMRYMSYQEKRPQYRSGDDLALVIMNDFVRMLGRLRVFRTHFLTRIPAGMYEYVIARTKYLDGVFEKALTDGTEQVLILGAGFYTRGIRFGTKAPNVRIFELDAPVTQLAKIRRYKEKGIAVPGNLIFIPIDFDRQSIADRLEESGFDKGKKCLYILEGLVMYLLPETITALFQILRWFLRRRQQACF
jgi:methyltransferase (TIGR00027 family)